MLQYASMACAYIADGKDCDNRGCGGGSEKPAE